MRTMKAMKNFKRLVVAASMAAMCLTATAAQGESKVEAIDLKELGIDSATLSHMNDSSVLELTRMVIGYKNKKEELLHEEQLAMMRSQSQSDTRNNMGVIFIVGLFSIIPILCIFIYKVIVSRSRRRREEANNEMLLKLVSNGQTLTPELVEAITKDSKLEKTAKELTMNSSLRKLFLGIGLILFAVVAFCTISGKDPVSPFIALIGIFYAAQGLAGYLTLRQERQDSETVETSGQSETE